MVVWERNWGMEMQGFVMLQDGMIILCGILCGIDKRSVVGYRVYSLRQRSRVSVVPGMDEGRVWF